MTKLIPFNFLFVQWGKISSSFSFLVGNGAATFKKRVTQILLGRRGGGYSGDASFGGVVNADCNYSLAIIDNNR